MPTIARVFDPVKQLWYQDIPGRGRVYDSPAAYGQSLGDPGGGAFHKNAQWDQDSGTVDRGLDWGKIYAWAIGAGLGAQAALAIANAASAGGAASGAASGGEAGTLPATTLPGSSTLGGGMTAGASAGVAGGTGTAGAAGIFDAATRTGQQGVDLTQSLTGGGNTLAKLAAGLGGLFGGKALGHLLDPSGGVSPELTQLLQLSLERAKAQQPLFNQVNSGVSQMLPNFASKDGLGKLMGG